MPEPVDIAPVPKTPAVGPRPDKGKMSDAEVQSLLSGLVTSAVHYIDLSIQPGREKASKYYKGEPFGNEEPGRSQVVLTEVHDSVQAILPPILRALFSDADRVVEFVPRRADAVEAAEQATDYCSYIFLEENNGFLKTHANLKDGLVRTHGIFKFWWDATPNTETHKLFGVTQEQIELLGQEKGIEFSMIQPAGAVPGPAGPDGAPTVVPTFDVEFTRVDTEGCLKVDVLPPEEFICNREARSLDDAVFVAHRMRKTAGELIALGVDPKIIAEHGGDDTSLRDDPVAQTRDPVSGLPTDTDGGEANDRHLYIEGFARIDYNGDGVQELRKVCLLGPSHYPVTNEVAEDGINFSLWSPDPEPHTLMGGRSWADRTMDMQRLKSSLMRSTLDSAASAIFPRTWYKEGDANLADVLNTAIGAPIRTRSGSNAVGEFTHSFMGKELLPLLGLADDIVERRTGQNKGVVGMDADALQSSTKTAVAAAVTAAAAQQELVVRMFAEQALKPLFKGMLTLLVKYQPRPKLVRLRGKWVMVDPRKWDAGMDVRVNVVLGAGLTEEKVQTLLEIKAAQEQILAMAQDNPIVNIKQYRDTLAQIAVLRGFKDPSRFFMEISDEQVQQMKQAAQQAAQNPPPNPEMMKAQAQIQLEQVKLQAKIAADQEQAKAQAALEQAKAQIEVQREQIEAEQKMALEQVKAAVERERMLLEDDRERDKTAADIQLKIAEMELKYQTNLSELVIDAQIERERMATQSSDNAEKVASNERVASAKAKTAGGKVTRQVGKAKPAGPKRRRVTFERDANGRAVGATIEDMEESE